MICRALWLVLFCLCLVPEATALWVDKTFTVMGTVARVRLWHDDAKQAEMAVEAVEREMHRIDAALSPFRPDSELSRVNAHAAKTPIPVSDELFRLLLQANAVSRKTNGAFDVTFSSVGFLYDFRRKKAPDAKTIAQRRPLINYRAIILNPAKQTVAFTHTGMRIDLGGIAKGYAVDRCIQLLRQYGVREALVSAGGDSYALGDNFGKLWRIGIQHPRQQDAVIRVLPVKDTAVSTSGDYERFFIDEHGNRIHHIINPKTGKPVQGIESVTILAPNTTLSDALSTSVFVLGVQKGLTLVESMPNVSAVIVDSQGNVHYSSDLVSKSVP